MATYVAFLRGINLGPSNKISMPALRAMAEDLGYTDVATYINSGNLIISSTKKAATVEREISKGIKDSFRTPDRCHGAYAGTTEEHSGREPLLRTAIRARSRSPS